MTKNEVRIPGYFEDGAQYANAWLASHPAGSENLAIWGCWDDPAIGAIGALRAQNRDDVKVYGVNGNAQALENIKNGFMTATAWQDSFTEGYNMVKMLKEIKDAGASGSRRRSRCRPSWSPRTRRRVPHGASRRDPVGWPVERRAMRPSCRNDEAGAPTASPFVAARGITQDPSAARRR